MVNRLAGGVVGGVVEVPRRFRVAALAATELVAEFARDRGGVGLYASEIIARQTMDMRSVANVVWQQLETVYRVRAFENAGIRACNVIIDGCCWVTNFAPGVFATIDVIDVGCAGSSNACKIGVISFFKPATSGFTTLPINETSPSLRLLRPSPLAS